MTGFTWRRIVKTPFEVSLESLRASRRNCAGRIVENYRPIFWNRPSVKSLDVAQVGETLYSFSAGFLTFQQSDLTSCLNPE